MKFFCIIFFFANEVYARSGGAGGGSSFSSGYSRHRLDDIFFDFIIDIIYFLFTNRLGIPILLILAAIYFLIILPNSKKKYVIQKPNFVQNLNPLRKINEIKKEAILSNAEKSILIKKAEAAFVKIQKAWSEKKIEKIRRFITDGIYQRYVAQLQMMKSLDQINIIENLLVYNVEIAGFYLDGDYQVVDLKIQATSEDQFISAKYKELNSPGGQEDFTEYWTFIRRSDCSKNFDLFNSENCPQCSAVLTDQLLETAKCPHCGTYLNNCEFDWVLSEVTQEDDYIARYDTPNKLNMPHFSKQLLEDQASNAFMQMISSAVNHAPQQLKRFCSDQACQQAATLFPQDYVYNRLYLNSVDLVKISIQKNTYLAELSLKYTSQRIKQIGENIKIFDLDLKTQQKKIVMVKEINNEVVKGNIYANACSTCGATQKSSLSSKCEYCGTVLNNRKHNWIVEFLI